ncbi:MAG: glycosyltransferase [Ignavibacteriales bacterium]|nr:MAG: glycosyltransferase [Ignavibacteriales bacterium]
MEKKQNKVIMIDSLIGNDYTLCLGLSLFEKGMNLELIVPENREFNMSVPFIVKKWSPAKDDSYGKIRKTYKYLYYLIRLLTYTTSAKDSIVHFQFFRRRGDSIVFFLLSLLGVKLVFTAHNIFPHEKNMFDWHLRNLVYKSASAIIVHSEYIRNKLLNNFKIDDGKVYVIPHGNFDIYLQKAKIAKTEARNKLKLLIHDKVLLFFGFLREYKGLDLLLNAFSIAKNCDEQLKLVIAGYPMNDTVKNKYLNRIGEICADGRILAHLDFIPSENIQDYFEASDVVILPYKNIDHSGIVHLAYSFHRPIIASSVGDFPETVEHEKSGYVLTENTAENLSETILKATSDMNKLTEMGEYAGYLNDTKYSWVNISNKTTELYRSL